MSKLLSDKYIDEIATLETSRLAGEGLNNAEEEYLACLRSELRGINVIEMVRSLLVSQLKSGTGQPALAKLLQSCEDILDFEDRLFSLEKAESVSQRKLKKEE